MGTNKVTRNVDNKLAFPSAFPQSGIGIVANKTDISSYNGTTTREITLFSPSAFPFMTPTASTESFTGDSSRNRFQYYIIGVYAFFVGLFVLCILIIIATKLYKACCTESHDDEYDSMPQGDVNASDNSSVEHHVNVDPTDVGTPQDYDSDYDYYSDASNGDRDDLKEKPPDYEQPPSYTIVLQNSMQV